MAARRPATRPTPVSRAVRNADWAFHADDGAVLDALVSGRHAQSLREYFGAPAYAQLSVLAAAAKQAKQPRGPKVLILPGIMGSKIGEARRDATGSAGAGTMRRGAFSKVLWIDPLQIAAGRLTALTLPSGKALCAVGVQLFSYAKLKLQLEIGGREAHFHAYDWRLGLDELGAQLAARITADGQPVVLVAHSMGGLVARMAARMLPKRWVRRIIMLGTPNEGSFASVQALRGTYPFVRKMSRLDRKHSAEYLAAKVFNTFPGLYHMLPRRLDGIDLFDPRNWPADGPTPSAQILKEVEAVRAALAPPDSRMVHIVGVNQETVVGMRRTAAGFEYAMTKNGDGTVPLALATLPKLRCYFVEELHGNLANNGQVIQAIIDLVRRGRTRRLPGRWRVRRGPEQRVDDTQLRKTENGEKIDWGSLTSAEREAIVGELDSARLVIRDLP
jgi:pimeloyl-ACP methyl ester carboxylesterase